MRPPTLVLLPGMDGTARLFAPLLAALGDAVPTRAVRYPTNEALGYDALEALVRDVLPAAPYVVLGESFSGPIALSIAASRPPALVGVVLVCTFARNPRPALAWLRGAVAPIPPRYVPRGIVHRLLLGAHARGDVRAMLTEALADVAGSALAARLKALAGVDVTQRLSAIDVPVLSLVARDDRLVPRSASSDLARRCPWLTEVVLDGPHALLQTRPEAAAEAIVAFVSRLTTTIANAANSASPGHHDPQRKG